MKIFAALITLFILVGCDHSSKEEDNGQQVNKVLFVKGDPHSLIAGAKLDPQSPITAENIETWNSMSLIFLQQFVEQEEVIVPKDTNITKENETTDHTQGPEKNLLQVEVKKSTTGLWQLSMYSGQIVLELEATEDQHLQPVRVIAANQVIPIRVLHWSTTPDGNYQSILFEMGSSKEGRSIAAGYFEKTAPAQAVPTTDTKYVYSSGPGKKIGWPSRIHDLKVQLCGSQEYLEMAQKSVDAWNSVLKNRINIDFSYASSYAPFSDLNQHCIYIVDSYLMDSRSSVLTYGLTMPVRSLTRLEFVDADIFMFSAEINKVYKAAADLGYSRDVAVKIKETDVPIAITHEMGHMLGLGHKFDGTKSIMSYDYNTSVPTSYDIEALAELYPLQQTSSASLPIRNGN